jgi:hypothetical protein
MGTVTTGIGLGGLKHLWEILAVSSPGLGFPAYVDNV